MSLPTPTTGGRSFDPKALEAMDAPLMALAQSSGGDLRKLLYAFFSFLHRRTDFYMVPHEDDKDVKMGFREGDAEKVLLAAFRQFPLRKMPRQSEVAAAKKKMMDEKQKQAEKSKAPPKANPESKQATEESAKNSTSRSIEADKEEVRVNEDGLQIPVGNGGAADRYKWTQTIEECSVLVGVGGLKAKELDVSIKPGCIAVRSKKPGPGGNRQVFVEGDLTEKILPAESTWTLEGGVLVLVLYKQVKTFWEAVLKGDPKIDTSECDSRRHIDEYDESTQAQIRKIIFDQSQARKGLPTSDEIAGGEPKIPPLPSGIEYIDQATLDSHSAAKPSSK